MCVLWTEGSLSLQSQLSPRPHPLKQLIVPQQTCIFCITAWNFTGDLFDKGNSFLPAQKPAVIILTLIYLEGSLSNEKMCSHFVFCTPILSFCLSFVFVKHRSSYFTDLKVLRTMRSINTIFIFTSSSTCSAFPNSSLLYWWSWYINLYLHS